MFSIGTINELELKAYPAYVCMTKVQGQCQPKILIIPAVNVTVTICTDYPFIVGEPRGLIKLFFLLGCFTGAVLLLNTGSDESA